MKKIINFKGQDVTLASNALTPFLYTQIFHEDFMRVIVGFRGVASKHSKTNENGESVVDVDGMTDDEIAELTKRSESFAKMAFIMAKQAEIGEAARLVNLDTIDFYEWLSEIEPQAFGSADVISGILELWNGNSKTTTNQKN